MLRWIMHVDMDAFFASVEMLDNPELRGLLVIVGGQSMRSVVSTCSYEARKFGVHSAMPIVQAKKLCPQGVYVPVRMARYQEVSHKIMQIFSELSPKVEQLSIDEAFLDISGMERLHGSALAVARLAKQRIKEEIGITASVGLAPNKFLAKMASDMQKPDGLTVIKHEEAKAFIAPLPVTKIFGIGEAARKALLQFGIVTIGQLAEMDEMLLKRVFGKNAAQVHLLACGIDQREVMNATKAKSIGREVTFENDLHGREECKKHFLTLSGMVGYRLRKSGYYGRTLSIKIKYADFKTITRSITSESDISCDEEIYQLAVRLLNGVNLLQGVRLLGITVSGLSRGTSLGLAFADDEKRQKRNAATDALKARFGEKIIFRGSNVN